MSKNDNEKIEWLNILGNCTEELFNIACLLDRYSDSFYTVGNTKMGNLLYSISGRLQIMSKEISKASGIVTSEMVNSAAQNSWNVLQGTLAGVKIAKENRKKEEKEDR